MKINFSDHALLKIKQRNLAKERVIEVVDHPERREVSYNGRYLAEKNFGKLNLRVIYKQEDRMITIITAYWHERK